jgi:hypothetical protein
MNRWDWLLEQKPRPLVEQLLDEVAKRLARDLEQWPPPIDELDLTTGRRFAPLLEPGSARPGWTAYEEAFRLARWELARDVLAIDEYMRQQRYLERGLGPGDRLVLQFLSLWLTESLLGLAEATEGRIKRVQLADCLDRTEGRLRQISLG